MYEFQRKAKMCEKESDKKRHTHTQSEHKNGSEKNMSKVENANDTTNAEKRKTIVCRMRLWFHFQFCHR